MSPQDASGTTSIFQLVRERRRRDALYHDARYWDARASARKGLARSIWPSNTYNVYWDERQRSVLLRALGDLRGRRIADVGAGTGRMTRFFADAGAREVVGIDFSPATVESARAETEALGGSSARVRFEVGDVVAGLDHVGVGAFDDAVVLGCLSVACKSQVDLQNAFTHIARLVREGGRVAVFEPIHRSRLLRRVLALGTEEWVAVANAAGLDLVLADRMGLAPLRLVLSVRDMPRAVVGPLFRVGERVLDDLPSLAPLADYKLLVFRKRGG